ncbi:MAG: methyltransferase [bacterium]|nr:methyltransferase [bacterium]
MATPPPDALFQLAQGFMASKTFLAAVDLELFTVLAREPLDAEGVRAALGLHPRAVRDFLDTLVALGVLERDGDRYRNGPLAAAYLDRTQPGYVGGFFTMLNRRLWTFWGRLEEALRTGAPQNEARDAGGTSFFETLYADPARLQLFLESMTGVSLPSAQALAERLPWARWSTVADVGCAQGGVPVTLALRHPHLRAIGFDLPQVEPVFRAYAAANEVEDRVDFVAGSFFTDPLPRAEVIVMGHILHDWDLDEKRRLVRKAYDALPEGGALVVYDAMIDDERRANVGGLLISLTMLIETPGGFDYTHADGIGWLREAGFRDVHAEPLAGIDSMVVGLK